MTHLSVNSFNSGNSQHSPNNSQNSVRARPPFSGNSKPQRFQSFGPPLKSLNFANKSLDNVFRQADNDTKVKRQKFSKPSNIDTTKPDICYYHSSYGAKARNCRKGCEFKSATTTSNFIQTSGDVGFCHAGSMNSWFIFDPVSQRSYFIDAGSSKSLIAANDTKKDLPPRSYLKAANGTDIVVYGEKSVALWLGNPPRNVTYPFHVTSLKHNIIGLDLIVITGCS